MKKILLPLGLSLLLFSCGSDENPDLKRMKERKEKLKAELSALNDSILELSPEQKSNAIVKTIDLKLDTFQHFFIVQANVESDQNINIIPEFAGIIEEVYVKDGQQVKVGQRLIKINTDILDQQINELVQKMELAKFVFDKQTELHNQGIGSELEYQQAKSNYNSLKENLKTLKTQRSKAVITSPLKGFVDEVFAKKGEMASQQNPVLRMMNLKEVKAIADISEHYLPIVDKGTFVNVNFPTINQGFDGLKVTKKGKFINPNNRTFVVEVNLPNERGVIIPNLTADLYIRDQFIDSAMVVPSQSIMQDNQGKDYVFVNQDGYVKKKSIETGKFYNGTTHVISGLELSDKVIYVGHRGVRPGDKISVVE